MGAMVTGTEPPAESQNACGHTQGSGREQPTRRGARDGDHAVARTGSKAPALAGIARRRLEQIALFGWRRLVGQLTVPSLPCHKAVQDFIPIELAGLYWHFVDIVWIFLYPLLYLINPKPLW